MNIQVKGQYENWELKNDWFKIRLFEKVVFLLVFSKLTIFYLPFYRVQLHAYQKTDYFQFEFQA